MDSFAPAIAITASVMVALGLLAGPIKNRLWLSEPLLCFAVGIALAQTDLLRLDIESDALLIEHFARATIAVSVFGAALRFRYTFVAAHAGEIMVVLFAGMALMAAVSAGLAFWLTPLPVLAAVLVGAIVTPTDPVLAGSIVRSEAAKRLIPSRLRHMLSVESAANDGLALLLVMLPILLLTRPEDAFGQWLSHVLVREVGGALVVGGCLGMAAGWALRMTDRAGLAENTPLLTVGLALTATAVAWADLLQVNGILAAFAAGVLFSRSLDPEEDAEEENVQDALGRFFELPVFILFGAALPWQAWFDLGWPLVVFATSILLLRRPPAWFLLAPLCASLRKPEDILFNGWFGPVGIAALYYAVKADAETGVSRVWPLVTAVVALSIVVHGVTATPLTRLYGRMVDAVSAPSPS